MTTLSGLLFQRFADLRDEQRYRLELRRQQAKFIRALMFIGGVISAKRISYDYWGDTINLASRLQDVAPANGIAVSAATYALVRDSYAFAPPRKVALKGLGEVDVYDLEFAAPG